MRTEPRLLPITYAALVLKGDDLDPDLASSVMRTAPTLAYRRGDAYTLGGKDSRRRFGLWVFSTRDSVRSTDLGDHVASIEAVIRGGSLDPRGAMRALRAGVPDIECHVDLFWHGLAGAQAPEIGAAFRQHVMEFGGTVETDFHRADEAVELA